MEQWVNLVGSVGFPIAACFACFWFINNSLKDIRTALENNTLVINKLITKLDMEEKNNGNIDKG